MEHKSLEQIALMALKATGIICFVSLYVAILVYNIYYIGRNEKIHNLIAVLMTIVGIFLAIFSGIYCAEYKCFM